MYDLATRAEAISLCRSGIPNADIASKLGVPKGTIGSWKYWDRQRHPSLYPETRADIPYCPFCHGADLDQTAYAYLLGLYLGDGHIVKPNAHRVYNLAIACADAWPGLMIEAAECLTRIIPCGSVIKVQRKGMHEIKMYSKHWPCMFPQHGPGRKHERKIELADWQQAIVYRYPQELVRGLIHSDGCRIANWTEKVIAGETKRYEYPRYFFTNYSEDIRQLFTSALDVIGIEWKYANSRNISVAKRASVALMDTFVGPKY
jgi:hypothetical protein